MYKHVVLWKLKEKVDGKSRAELAAEVKKRLDTLPGFIPEIVEYETGINTGNYGASFYDVSLISVFDNKETFWNYTKYPEHDAVVEYIKSVQEAEQIVDYEF
ncbi:MAG: Dabb family protein [Bacteroidetes bacterium]|nr:Dabb family protein [Bacteroidota bacterium]